MADRNVLDDEHAPNLFVAALYAAVGGSLPTLCKLAPMGAGLGFEKVLTLGHLFAILIYALIGFSLCLGFRERKFRQAFLLGIAGPGVVTNILAGLPAASSVDVNAQPAVTISLFEKAYAQPEENTQQRLSSGFWTDVKRGLGFSLPVQTSGEHSSSKRDESSSKQLVSSEGPRKDFDRLEEGSADSYSQDAQSCDCEDQAAEIAHEVFKRQLQEMQQDRAPSLRVIEQATLIRSLTVFSLSHNVQIGGFQPVPHRLSQFSTDHSPGWVCNAKRAGLILDIARQYTPSWLQANDVFLAIELAEEASISATFARNYHQLVNGDGQCVNAYRIYLAAAQETYRFLYSQYLR